MRKKVDTKYVHLYANEPTNVLVISAKDTRKYAMQKGEYIYNIVVDRPSKIISDTVNAEVEFDDTLVEFEASDERKYTKEQEEVNKELLKAQNISFRLKGNKENPNKLFIMMPSFSIGNLTTKHYITTYNQLGEEFFKKNLALILQDNYAEYGTYLMVDDNDEILIPKINTLIQKVAEKYNVSEENMVFFGLSKGGSISFIYGSHFPKSTIISMAPQIDVRQPDFFAGNLFALYQDVFKTHNLDFLYYLKKIMKNNQKIYLHEGMLDSLSHNHSFSKKYYENKNFNLVVGPNDWHNDTIRQVSGLNSYVMLTLGGLGDNFSPVGGEYELLSTTNDIRDIHLKFKPKTPINALLYIKLNDNILVKTDIKFEHSDKSYEATINTVDNITIGQYFPSYNLNDYEKISIVVFNVIVKSFSEIPIKKEELESLADRTPLEDNVKNKFNVIKAELSQKHMYVVFDANPRIPREIISLYREVKEPIKTYIRIKTTDKDEVNYYPLIRPLRLTFVHSYSYFDLKYELNTNDEVFLVDFFPDGKVYEEKITIDQLKEKSKYHFDVVENKL